MRSLLVAGVPPTTVPGDPLGTVSQDPALVRQQACKIVASTTQVCTPSQPPAPPSAPRTYELSWLSWLIWIVLVVAVLALLVVVVRSLMNRTSRGRRIHPSRGENDVDDEVELQRVAVDRSREPFDWRGEADSHRRAGRYRDALRCRYRALVGDLARRGLIDEIPGRTTGEERAQLRLVRPGISSNFAAAADLFDDAWYGHSDVGADDDDRFQSLERDVLAHTGSER